MLIVHILNTAMMKRVLYKRNCTLVIPEDNDRLERIATGTDLI